VFARRATGSKLVHLMSDDIPHILKVLEDREIIVVEHP
jgi:hypothetical protein